jgi:hypothetical protein
MYSQQRGTRAPHTSQSPSNAGPEPRDRRSDLEQHYKPVGIGAITAAAMCKSPRRNRDAGAHDAPQRR